MTGFSGSAVATVSTLPSTLTGQTAYWRRYFGERFFTIGSGDGQLVAGEIGEILLLRERPEHVVVLDGAERDECLADPLARGPRARGAFSTTSGVVSRSRTRISPSRRKSAVMPMLCSRSC